MRTPVRSPNERGVALVIALLVLLVITLLAVVLMAGVSVNRQVAGQDVRMRKALNIAEAGLGEAMARIKNNDAALDAANPRATAQIFLTTPGSVPVEGVDTTALATVQTAGTWLAYSTPTKSNNVLTVRWKTDPGRTVIYKYDATKNPAVQTTSGLPIYQIFSTGLDGTARRAIVAEVIRKPYFVNAKAALAANVTIIFNGTSQVCGYNHSADTPDYAGDAGRGNVGTGGDCVPWEIGGGDLPASWTTSSTTSGGSALQAGTPSNNVTNGTGFYSGPWDMLSMPQADFLSWIGPPQANPSNLNGIIYVDNNATLQDYSDSFGIHGGSGEGMLYIDGNCTINAGFTYRGLIYIEGDLQLNGTAWILGGLVVHGQTQVKNNGKATILFSSDAITQKLAKYGGQFITLNWRETP